MTYLTEFMNRRMAITELWQPGEREAIWQHQLNTQLQVDLEPNRLRSRPSEMLPPEAKIFFKKSFGELLKHPQPPLELLKLIKDFAKRTLNSNPDPQLQEIVTALYYATYAAGLVRHGRRVGKLSGGELARGFAWALKQSWLDDFTRELVLAAKARLCCQTEA
jgi:hypothetical protein